MSVAFSPDSTRLASGSGDNSIRLWDTTSHRCTAVMRDAHKHWVSSVAWSPNGTRLASGSWDRSVKLWDVTVTPPTVRSLNGFETCRVRATQGLLYAAVLDVSHLTKNVLRCSQSDVAGEQYCTSLCNMLNKLVQRCSPVAVLLTCHISLCGRYQWSGKTSCLIFMGGVRAAWDNMEKKQHRAAASCPLTIFPWGFTQRVAVDRNQAATDKRIPALVILPILT